MIIRPISCQSESNRVCVRFLGLRFLGVVILARPAPHHLHLQLRARLLLDALEVVGGRKRQAPLRQRGHAPRGDVEPAEGGLERGQVAGGQRVAVPLHILHQARRRQRGHVVSPRTNTRGSCPGVVADVKAVGTMARKSNATTNRDASVRSGEPAAEEETSLPHRHVHVRLMRDAPRKCLAAWLGPSCA